MSNMLPYSQLDPRIQKNLDLLYDSFNVLLKEKHFKQIDVQEITKAARVSRGTFYNHFENIDDFIIFCSREGLRRAINKSFPINSFLYSPSNLKTLFGWIFDYIQSTYRDWHFQWDEILFEKATRIELYYYVVDWLRPGLSNPENMKTINTDALLISSAITGVGLVWCQNGCTDPTEELTERSYRLIADGLVNTFSSPG
jgi:AcrR family transcriptional regulator